MVGRFKRKTKRGGLLRNARKNAMYETAKLLIESAIKAHMEQFNVGREVTCYWIGCGAEVMACKS